MNTAIAIIAAYLIGSFPTAYLMVRLRKGIDIREVGSRNAGAMNVIYVVGVAEGILVLAIDIGKGTLAVFVARWLGAPFTAQMCAGIAAVVGHAFPVSLKFRGGRGGATCIGVFAALVPPAIPIYIGIFLLGLLTTRFPTLSYGVAFVSFPVVAWVRGYPVSVILLSLGLPLVMGVRYLPRVKEMRGRGGGWRRVFLRSSFKERL